MYWLSLKGDSKMGALKPADEQPRLLSLKEPLRTSTFAFHGSGSSDNAPGGYNNRLLRNGPSPGRSRGGTAVSRTPSPSPHRWARCRQRPGSVEQSAPDKCSTPFYDWGEAFDKTQPRGRSTSAVKWSCDGSARRTSPEQWSESALRAKGGGRIDGNSMSHFASGGSHSSSTLPHVARAATRSPSNRTVSRGSSPASMSREIRQQVLGGRLRSLTPVRSTPVHVSSPFSLRSTPSPFPLSVAVVSRPPSKVSSFDTLPGPADPQRSSSQGPRLRTERSSSQTRGGGASRADRPASRNKREVSPSPEARALQHSSSRTAATPSQVNPFRQAPVSEMLASRAAPQPPKAPTVQTPAAQTSATRTAAQLAQQASQKQHISSSASRDRSLGTRASASERAAASPVSRTPSPGAKRRAARKFDPGGMSKNTKQAPRVPVIA